MTTQTIKGLLGQRYNIQRCQIRTQQDQRSTDAKHIPVMDWIEPTYSPEDSSGDPKKKKDPHWGSGKVKEDETIKTKRTPRYGHLGMEVVSRVLKANFKANNAGSEVLVEVTKVADPLNTRIRSNANHKTCGLHVHTGNEDKGFNSVWIKKLIATLYTFKPTFQASHPSHRRNHPFCKPSRQHANWGKGPMGRPDDGNEWPQRLSGMQNFDDLVYIVPRVGRLTNRLG